MLFFSLQTITYLLMGFGGKQLKAIKMKRLFKRQEYEVVKEKRI